MAALKTSGAKGVHLYIPVRRRHHYGVVRDSAARLGELIVQREPELATMEFKRASRGHRVFVDVGRNRPGAHIVAPYSPRARPGATISFPIEWKQLQSAQPADFTLTNVPGLLDAEGDRWRELMPEPQSLPASLTE